MKEFSKKHKALYISVGFLLLFIAFTLIVKFVDVQAIGPRNSKVGLATFNNWVHQLFGEHINLYTVTDWASIITIPIGFIFLIVGIVEWIKRKNILKVDNNILALGLFYVLDLICYLTFQFVKINYRPVLLNGNLETSYPSSTMMLSLTMFISTIDQVCIYLKDKKTRISLITFCSIYSAFLIIGRLVSGVHWCSDIIGALLLSVALLFGYFELKKLTLKINEGANKHDAKQN